MQGRRFLDGFEMHSELSPEDIVSRIVPFLEEYRCNVVAERIGRAVKRGRVSPEDLEGTIEAMNDRSLMYITIELMRMERYPLIKDEEEYYPYMLVKLKRGVHGDFEVSARDRSLNPKRASILDISPRRNYNLYQRRR